MFYKNINSNIWNKYNKNEITNLNHEYVIFSKKENNNIDESFINYATDFLEKNSNHIVLNNSFFANKLLKYNLFTNKSITKKNDLIYKNNTSNLDYIFICSNEIVDKENPINILFNDKYNIHIYSENNLDDLQDHKIENVENKKEQKVKIYTMSNIENIHLKRLLNSAEYYNVKIDVIRPEIWTSNLMKIELLKEKLESHKPDDIVMLIDAWDIIISADSETIYQKFLKFNSKVVFSAQYGGNLWARHSQEEREVEREYYSRNPKSPNIYDTLCAGSFIGYAESLLDIINHMMDKYTELETKSEQSFYTRYFIDYPEKIKLDYYQELFSCENPVKTNKRKYWLFGRSYKTSPDNLRVIDNKTYNLITKTNPSIIHTPSNQYEYLDKLYYRHIFNDDTILNNYKYYNVILGITTINKLSLLKKCIESFNKTKSNNYNWTLIIADDKSDDGTFDYIKNLKINCNLIIIVNGKKSISYQTNTIFKCAQEIGFDYLFKVDDDVEFIKKGWDKKYIDAINKTNNYHLITIDNHVSLTKKNVYTSYKKYIENLIYCVPDKKPRGYFFTITPKVLNNIGFFDENKYPYYGTEHKDYSLRYNLKFNKKYYFDIIHGYKYITFDDEKFDIISFLNKFFLLLFLILFFKIFILGIILGIILFFSYSLQYYLKNYNNSKRKTQIKKKTSQLKDIDINNLYVDINKFYEKTQVYIINNLTNLKISNDYFKNITNL